MNFEKTPKISKKNAASFEKSVMEFFEVLIMIGAATSIMTARGGRRIVAVVGKNGLMRFTIPEHYENCKIYTVFRSYDPTTSNEGCHLKFNFHESNRKGLTGEEIAERFIQETKKFLLDGSVGKYEQISEVRKNLKIKHKKIT